jgi:hypothetical protein
MTGPAEDGPAGSAGRFSLQRLQYAAFSHEQRRLKLRRYDFLIAHSVISDYTIHISHQTDPAQPSKEARANAAVPENRLSATY